MYRLGGGGVIEEQISPSIHRGEAIWWPVLDVGMTYGLIVRMAGVTAVLVFLVAGHRLSLLMVTPSQ